MKGWERKTVSEIARHSLGKMLDKAKNKGELKPYLRNFNVRWFDFDLSDVSEMRFLPEENEKYMAVKGDVLVCEGGYPGRAAIWDQDEPIYFQKALHRVRFHEPERNRWFLYYLFSKDLDGTLKSHFNGAGIQHFTGETLAQFEVPLPPLPEQRRIVDILDEAFEGIASAKANAEKNLLSARALFESHLQSVFSQRGEGWVETPLAELCDSKRVITYGVIKLGEEIADGIPCLRTSNVRWLRIDTNGMKRISPALSSEYSRTILRGGEVLVNVRGTLGGVAVAEPEMAGWNVSREVAVVPVDSSRVNPGFLSYLIGSGASQQWLGAVKKGAAYVGINIEDLRLLPVCAPGVDEQSVIVRYLREVQDNVQGLASIYERKLAALEALKKSLLDQAFSGKL